MGQVHRSNRFRRRCLFQKGINSLLMKSGFEEVLQFGKYPVDISSKLDLKSGPLFDKLHPETAKVLEVHHIDVLRSHEPVRLGDKCFGNNVGINLVGLRFTDVVLTHRIRLDRVDDADLVASGNEEFNQVITVVCRGFKTNDEAGALVRIEDRGQPEEAIIVVGEFERLDEYFTFGRDDGGKVIEFGNVDANVVHSETLLSVSRYCGIHQRLSS